MGNAHSVSSLTRTTGALDSFIADLGGEIVYEKNLGTSRFLKAVKCKHQNGPLVTKIYIKHDPGLSLRNYHKRLKADKEALADIPNVYNFQAFVETEKAGYIFRQWVASNLYDRISTRPFLSMIEKRWVAFQLLNALRDARNRKVSHGDIKSQNILVTSWNWVYLTDFASYKPTYLPLDDPADFSFFFDTSGRRTCYIAPERFYTATDNPEISAKKTKIAMDDEEGRRDGKVTEAMDCFSAGCVIAELFLEGAQLFALSDLYKYRVGEYSVEPQLATIGDEGVQNLIKQMISLDPAARPTFDTLLQTSRGTVFPECFYSFLHNYVSTVNELPSNPPFPSPHTANSTAPPSIAPSSSGNTIRPAASTGVHPTNSVEQPPNDLPSDSDHRIEKIWSDYESVEPYISPEATEEATMNVKVEYTSAPSTVSKPFQDILPVELHIPNHDPKLSGTVPGGKRAAHEDGPALIILALVTSNIRNCSLPSSKVHALDVFLALASHLTDEAKLDRMVPYVVELLHDESALVRLSALRTLIQVLMLVTVITPLNAAIFPEYIIPNIRHLVHDSEVSVRCTYAQCLVQIADTALRYLEIGQALKAHGALTLATDVQDYENAHFEVSYDASVQELQLTIQDHLSALLTDASSIVKRAVLHDISSLCIFLGRQATNDVLLSHMITYLNDRDWLLRYAFFESIVEVAACAGGRSLEEYILPLMLQALCDVEETVVAKVLSSLTSLCELGLFQKIRIWELMSNILGFLYHPNLWIRQNATAFIVAAVKQLPDSDIWCILYPSLRHYLKSDIITVDEESLLLAMKPALPRQILDFAVQWAMKAESTSFWRRRNNNVESPRESMISMKKGTGALSRNRSEEDEAQITKLQKMGMSHSDENKLQSMRDYIVKLALATSSFSSRLISEPDAGQSLKVIGDVELQKLGVVPQTVFLKSKGSDFGPRSSRIPSSSFASRRSSRTTPILSPRMGGRFSTLDQGSVGSAAPFEDLRRRLATINGSASSLGIAPGTRESRGLALSPAMGGSSPITPPIPPPMLLDRPASPTESSISATNSLSIRPSSRVQMGSTDVQKAAPAIGSSKMNAIGLLEAHSKLRELSPDRSGRTSPMSMSATLRPSRPRLPSLAPISTYDGQEPGISNLLEDLYLDNNRELQQDFGPKVHEGPIRRRNPVRHGFASRDSTKRVEPTLIANLVTHTDAVTGIAVSPDHMYFVTASDDKTVKVWDTARLERNVTSKPRYTHAQHHAKVKAVCTLEGVHCFASAADDGSLHVVRVHVGQGATGAAGAGGAALPKYGKLQVVREHRVDRVGEWITCMTHYNTDSASNLIYATTHSIITVLDLRTMQVLQTMENPRHYGPITCLCVDKKRTWILVGTSTGVMTLWDKRFGLLLRSWHVGVGSTGRSVRIHQCVIHPSKGRGKWVMVAVEVSRKGAPPSDKVSTNLVEVWDIEKAALMESFVMRTGSKDDAISEPHEMAGVDADTSPSAAIAALVRSRQVSDPTDRRSPRGGADQLVPPPVPDVRAMVVGLDFGGYSTAHRSEFGELVDANTSPRTASRGFMITGSEDRKLRLWDLGRPERTAVLSGLENESEKPAYSMVTNGNASSYVETWSPTSGLQSNRPSQRIALISNNQNQLLKAHLDVVTALACIDSPFRGGIVSGDRAGVVKVWRIDYVDQ